MAWFFQFNNTGNCDMNILSSDAVDELCMELVFQQAKISPDHSSHIGAVIIGPHDSLVAVGFNRFPVGVDDEIPERHERPEKYFYSGHAEANAVAHAARKGIATEGCRIYTNGTPCSTCAIAIIEAGIVEVIIDLDWETRFNLAAGAEWEKSLKAATAMFAEHRPQPVKLRAMSNFKTECPRFLRGQFIAY